MLAAFIKGITRRLLGKVRAIYIEECTSNDQALLDSINFRPNFFDQFDNQARGARRDIARIEQVTQFQTEIPKNRRFDIISPFNNKRISSKSSRAPFLSTFHSILYNFDDKVEFTLIASDYWMEVMAIYLPKEKLLVVKRAGHIDLTELLVHDSLVRLSPTASSRRKSQNKTSVVLYHKHLAHHILNELSALQDLVDNKLVASLDQIYYHDLPIARLEKIFPEIPVSKFQHISSQQLNWDNYHPNSFIVPFQKSKLNPSIKEKILQACDDKEQINRRGIRDQHYPIIWVSVRTGNRVWENQSEGLSLLSKSLAEKYKHPLIIVDGYSMPYQNQNNSVTQEIQREKEALENLKAEANIDCDLMSLIGKPVEEVLWLTQIADYYITHCGTLHHKISWMADIPGLVHCNKHYTNLPEHLTPGFREHNYSYPPIKLSSAYIADSNSERQNRDGKLLPQKFSNYTIDSQKLVETFVRMIEDN